MHVNFPKLTTCSIEEVGDAQVITGTVTNTTVNYFILLSKTMILQLWLK